MTAHRFNQLKAGAVPLPEEVAEYQDTLAWEKRHNAAREAVRTKRKKYVMWPTRKRKAK